MTASNETLERALALGATITIVLPVDRCILIYNLPWIDPAPYILQYRHDTTNPATERLRGFTTFEQAWAAALKQLDEENP